MSKKDTFLQIDLMASFSVLQISRLHACYRNVNINYPLWRRIVMLGHCKEASKGTMRMSLCLKLVHNLSDRISPLYVIATLVT